MNFVRVTYENDEKLRRRAEAPQHMALHSCSRVLQCTPRRSCRSIRGANQRSTRLVHEAPVGVKCKWS